jgi:hypothetical protein
MHDIVNLAGYVIVARVPDNRARQECEAAWRKAFPANATGSHVCWEKGVMYYTYALAESDLVETREAEYQLTHIDTPDAEWPQDGTYIVTSFVRPYERVKGLADARVRCEYHWRGQSGTHTYGVEWSEDGHMMQVPRDGSDPWGANFQLRLEPAAEIKNPGKLTEHRTGMAIDYATAVGKRTYHFDVLNNPLHSALHAAIREHNRNVEYWKDLAAKNREGIDDAQERQVSIEMALLVGGRFEGSGQVIDGMLRALGML